MNTSNHKFILFFQAYSPSCDKPRSITLICRYHLVQLKKLYVKIEHSFLKLMLLCWVSARGLTHSYNVESWNLEKY